MGLGGVDRPEGHRDQAFIVLDGVVDLQAAGRRGDRVRAEDEQEGV